MMSPTRTTRRAPAFTLIELLVVVAIIALLLSILLPSFSRARDLARSTATQARISTLSSACEMFKVEHGGYPGMTRWPLPGAYIRPVQAVDDGVLTGSQMLAMCLLDYYWNGSPHTNEPSWGSLATEDRPPRVYADLPDSARDEFAREEGEFITDPNDPRYRRFVTGRWRNTILDAFPRERQMPILYFVARPGQADVEDIYKWSDNSADAFDEDYLYGHAPRTNLPTEAELKEDFEDSITRSDGRPYRRDSYILVSAGIDRRWFTDDDNWNFEK